jgi:ABC-2 type transport system permease protein
MWRSFIAVAYKEFIQFFRNVMFVRMMLTMQMVQLVLLGSIDVNARDLPTVIVDQDRSAYSRELTQKLRATKTFDIKFTTSSVQQGREHVRAGRVKIAILIPPDYGRVRASNGTAKVMALVDGSDSVASGQALASIAGMTEQLTVEREAQVAEIRPLSAHSMLLFNPEGRTSNFMLPGLISLILTNAYLSLAAQSLVAERQQGTIERLLMTPLDFRGLLMGKIVPYLALAVTNIVLLLGVMHWVFGVPFRGSVLLAFLASVLFAATMLSLGVYIAAGAQNSRQVDIRQVQFQVPSMLLSGYIFPLTSLPWYLLPISYALPTTHMIEILRAITLRGAGFSDLWPNFAYLAIAPVVLLIGAVRRFRITLGV